MTTSIDAFVGSTNPNKVQAVFGTLQKFHSGSTVKVIPCNGKPGIVKWGSQEAVGQPFGGRQTAFGAINRMNDCWQNQFKTTYAIGLENGLVRSIEVGKQGQNWFDVCFIAVRSNVPGSSIVIKRGAFVQTEFAPPENSNQEAFDKAVRAYHACIMPQINNNTDLYLGWTKNNPDGPRTRSDYLSQCLNEALKEQSIVQEAHQIVKRCVEAGMAASAGPRYRHMLWTRDLAYMAPVYLQEGYDDQFLTALRNLKAAQCNKHESYNNGYESFDRFGNLPIVCIPQENQAHFLRQRLRGTEEEPFWQRQLKNFCQEKCPDKFFPDKDLESLSLAELTSYYHELLAFQKSLNMAEAPRPSFALQKFIEGTLENLTPGTRDSEIHYIRAFLTFVKRHPEKKEQLLEEFGASIAGALSYLFANVIDSEDGLPLGADSRDIFADLLYDSKVLSNALFWYQTLELLQEHVELKIPQGELSRLRSSIQNKLLFHGGEFAPRDFIPGRRAGLVDHPVNPSPVDKIITEDNPTFIHGKTVDGQSLALAVLTGLIDAQYYNKVIDYFEAADSPIGVRVFAPISGKTDKESLLLKEVKGQVVWPHVSWSIVRALIKMGTERSLNMAEEQRDKLMRLGGCGEWYAIDPRTQACIRGGDSQQGWAATGMIMAIDDFYRYYATI